MSENIEVKSEAAANIAIRRMRNQGHSVNEGNPEHVTAYCVLRLTHGRVDGQTLLTYLQNRQTDIGHGARSMLEYWAVPKNNFPNGLPDDIKGSQVTEEDLADATVLGGGHIDHDSIFIVDCEVPRTRLKKSVKILKFYTESRTTVAINVPATGSGSTTGGQIDEGALEIPLVVKTDPATGGPAGSPATGGTTGDTTGGTTGGVRDEHAHARRNVKRTMSEASDHEEPIVKRRRMLKETMADLRSGILAAATTFPELL